MKHNTKTKSRFALFYQICPLRHTLTLFGALVIAAHQLWKHNTALMTWLSETLVRPYHGTMAGINSIFPCSVAEVLIVSSVVGLVLYIVVKLCTLKTAESKVKELYRIILTPLCAAVSVYALFCLLWGVLYYADGLTERGGFDGSPVSIEQLEAVTRSFAALANETADRVARDENGVCCSDKAALLQSSAKLFEKAEEKFPCLAGAQVAAKGFYFSKLLSYLDFSGFFFPITAEANVNTDPPAALFASTAAHELAHQRGVAKEEEANFAAVLVSLESGESEFVYSAALLAYIHLDNALYSENREASEEIRQSLDEVVLSDLRANAAYWERFDTPVQEAASQVYEGFLQSYDQTLGLKSYGACVDLLVNYYGKTLS